MAKYGAEYGMAYSTKEEAERGYEEWVEQNPELHSYPVRIEPNQPVSGWYWYVDAREALING